MIIPLTKTRAQVADLRRRLYLSQWPVHQQMEAHADAAAGRPEKRDAMLADLAAIKAAHPYPPENAPESEGS